MVCDDCSRNLSGLAAPDSWKAGSTDRSKSGENKLLRKGVRSNPYGNYCKVCKLRVQITHATYCTQCAYGKGICAVCGKQVLDTTMYKMSEGGTSLHVVRDRDEAKFKSSEQMAREKAHTELMAFLSQTGQMGRMPTKGAFLASGHRELADAVIASYGGLHAAADAIGLSKQLLNDEAEARKESKRVAAVQAAEEAADRRAAECGSAATTLGGHEVEVGGSGGGDKDDDEDAPPPGVAVPAPKMSVAPSVPVVAAVAAVAAATADSSIAPPTAHPASSDPRWQYEPNNGLYYQLSTQTYYDHAKKMYFQHGKWTQKPPARRWR